MKKKREVTNREFKDEASKARELARRHRISTEMMATKGQRPKVTLPTFSWDKKDDK